jgi:hypothetical protein
VTAAGIFLAARAVTSVFLLWLTTQTGPASEAGPSPSFARLSSVWDGRWYQQIAQHGYPAHLPVDAHGHVLQNAWAFLPAYPWLTGAIAALSGVDWAVVAVAVSIAFGVGAALLLVLLLEPRVGRRGALFSVALFSCSPVAFMLQMAYADAMMACLLFAALVLLDRRRYGWAIPVVALASFTRPGVLAFALVCLIHLVRERRSLARSRPALVGALALLAAGCAGGLAWPAVVGWATGDPKAYFATETAWRSLWIGHGGFTVFQPWVFVAEQLFGVAGIAVLGALLLGCVLFLARPAARLGATGRIWVASYGLYLLAVFMPQTSLPRLLIPMSPALGAIPVPARRSVIVLVLVLSTVLQLLWLWCTYGPVKNYVTVP